MSFVIINDCLHDTDCSFYKHNIKVGRYSNIEGIFLPTIEEALLREPIVSCKCIQKKYKQLLFELEGKKKMMHFKTLLIKYAELSNVSAEENYYGDIVLHTKIETWIVSVIEVTEKENIAEICLYHKNNIEFAKNKNKCGTSLYPDYHIQYHKKQSIGDIVLYVLNHEAYRWRVQGTLSDTLKKLLKSL